MYRIQTLNKIAKCGLDIMGDKYQIDDNIENPDAIILRSFNMHDMEFGDNLKAIARAGAGVNNIPIDKCTEKGIVVFNTPGANANAVKELVIAGLLLSSRKIVDAMNWATTLKGEGENVEKLIEKGKSNFTGPEIEGKTLGVIGLGAIGVMVANAAVALGMDVIGYDPYISVDAAWGINKRVKKAISISDVIKNSEYITLHVPLNKETREMINKTSLGNAKDGIRVLNFSRCNLVRDDDMEEALKTGKVACYVTDFPNDKVIGMKNVIAIPHLGASTPESEDNCAEMAAQEIVNFLENGNIVNSVNFPECSMPPSATTRIAIAHKNVPAMITKISGLFSDKGINIENFMNKSLKDLAYTLIDTDAEIDDSYVQVLKGLEEILSVRVIKQVL